MDYNDFYEYKLPLDCVSSASRLVDCMARQARCAPNRGTLAPSLLHLTSP